MVSYGFYDILCRMTETIINHIAAAIDLILPRRCAVCGCRLNIREKHLCLPCIADIPLTKYWTLRSNPMADRFNELISRGDDRNEKYAFAAALFHYSSDADYRQIQYRLKYQGDIDIGRYFGKMLGRHLAGSELFRDVDAVIPVPLHWTRHWKRGYNQAEVIAEAVAKETGAPCMTGLLIRKRRTKTQTKVEVMKKSGNVKDAFALKNSCVTPQLHHILIIDDIFTTGSTLMACFTALRTVFPPSVRISVATLGFVGGA